LSVAARSKPSVATVDVILRDGSTLRLRAPAQDDAGALAAFFSGLSERSLYQRFHGTREIDDELVAHFLEPNWHDRGVLVGTLAGAEGDERIVAVGEYDRLRDPAAAEAAFAVADELQGHGIGTRFHEEPQVPNYGKPKRLMKLTPGLTIAIEPMVSVGTPKTRTMPDRWTVVTADGSRAAHFEHTVAITDAGPRVLTAYAVN